MSHTTSLIVEHPGAHSGSGGIFTERGHLWGIGLCLGVNGEEKGERIGYACVIIYCKQTHVYRKTDNNNPKKELEQHTN